MYEYHAQIVNDSGVTLDMDLARMFRRWSVGQVQRLADGETLELDADCYPPNVESKVRQLATAAGGDPLKVKFAISPYEPPEE